MNEEEARQQRETVMNRLDMMVRSIAASSQRMESAANGLLTLAESLNGLTDTLGGLDERLERIEEFFAWVSSKIPEGKQGRGAVSEILKIFGKNS